MQSLRPRLTYHMRIYILKSSPGDLYVHESLRDINLKLIEDFGLMLRAMGSHCSVFVDW